MKNSGIDWIGEIPEEWKVERAKFLFNQSTSKGNDRLVLLSATQDRGVIDKTKLEGVVQVDEKADLNTFKTVHINDFVISLRSFQGGFELCHEEGVISPAYTVFRMIKQSYPYYYKYLFKSIGFIDKINSITVGIREGKNIKYDDFANLLIPSISLSEQQRIADYLDRKCGEVDEMVALQEQMIEELKAYKQSVITEAVTHGLNPNAPMKPSNIDWIGDIPEHWEKSILSIYFKQRKNKNFGLYETNLLSLSYGNIIRKNINTNEGLLPESFETYNIVEKNDIVFRLTDLQNDKKSLRTGLCKERGIITSAYITLKHNPLLNSVYFHYLFHTYDILKVFYGLGDGIRQGMKYDDLKKLPILLPPLSEQREIADYLDRKCADIDALIAIKQQKIEDLKEYKKSLIYEYVTGKKQVLAN